MGKIANRQSLAFSDRSQLSQAIPQFHVERLLNEWTPIARFEWQHSERRVCEDQLLCFFLGRHDRQRTLAIQITAITRGSDSAIIIARFRPSKKNCSVHSGFRITIRVPIKIWQSSRDGRPKSPIVCVLCICVCKCYLRQILVGTLIAMRNPECTEQFFKFDVHFLHFFENTGERWVLGRAQMVMRQPLESLTSLNSLEYVESLENGRTLLSRGWEFSRISKFSRRWTFLKRTLFQKTPFSDAESLTSFDFLAFLLRNIPCFFLCAFALLSKDFKGSAERKILVFFRAPLFFTGKKLLGRKRGRLGLFDFQTQLLQ